MLFPWYTKYPYQNDEVLNLDWILKTIDNLVKEVSDFVTLNTIKYADPIQWNITTQYEKNTVVIDPISGSAYISTKPVPAGVGLNNTDYWNIIFTLDVISANKNITLRDDANNMLATFESAIGDWVLWQGNLYVVTKDIEIGEAYTENYNIERQTVEQFLKTYITNLYDSITAIIGDLEDLDTTDKSSIVNAINSALSYIDTVVGALTDLETTDQDSIVDAINELVGAISNLDTIIGDLTELETTIKTSIVGAINEVVGNCGDLDDLETTDKSSIVGAINEVVENSDDVYYNIVKHGADPTGVEDATSIINAGLSSGKVVFIPEGKFKITDTIIVGTGKSIIGVNACDIPAAIKGSILVFSGDDSKHAIEIGSGAQFVTISNLMIDRDTAGTPTGDGLHVNQTTHIKLTNITSQNHYNGFFLSSTGWSYITDCVAQKNYSHGFLYQNTDISGALQWQTRNCLSERNNGSGFVIWGIDNPYHVVSLGIFDGIATYANKQFGVNIYGGTVGVNGYRITNAFLGNDRSGEIHILSLGAVGGLIDSCYLEIAGAAGSGRDGDGTANDLGYGVYVENGSKDVTISNCHIVSCRGDGVGSVNDQVTSVIGCCIKNNGLSGSGVGVRQSARSMNIIGNIITGNATKDIAFATDAISIVAANRLSQAPVFAGGQTNIEVGLNAIG